MSGHPHPHPRLPARPLVTEVVHHVTLRHQVEIEVWPARAQLYFADERWTDPINTELRFEARVFNSRLGVRWEVRDPAGNPGAGSIDATGLYRAPDKGTLASGTTDIVIATAIEDPLRKAYAWMTLVGVGPLPLPEARIEIRPHVSTLYYQAGDDNAYMDASNKMQLFRAEIFHSGSAIEWLVNMVPAGVTGPWFQYMAPNTGANTHVMVRGRLQAAPNVYDDAWVEILNYQWPGF
jgi:hypothetical protein